MKLTVQALERMGVTNYGTQTKLMEIFQEMEGRIAELEEALAEKDGELTESKKLAALEKAILEGGGRNTKAILALVDMEKVAFDGKELRGFDLEAIRTEAPYLFHEKEEKTIGTGVKRGTSKKENEISAAFRKGLRR